MRIQENNLPENSTRLLWNYCIFYISHSGPNGQGTLITPQDIPDPTKQVMIQNLFGIFAMAGSNENEYAMKAIMRTLSLLQVGAMMMCLVVYVFCFNCNYS